MTQDLTTLTVPQLIESLNSAQNAWGLIEGDLHAFQLTDAAKAVTDVEDVIFSLMIQRAASNKDDAVALADYAVSKIENDGYSDIEGRMIFALVGKTALEHNASRAA